MAGPHADLGNEDTAFHWCRGQINAASNLKLADVAVSSPEWHVQKKRRQFAGKLHAKAPLTPGRRTCRDPGEANVRYPLHFTHLDRTQGAPSQNQREKPDK